MKHPWWMKGVKFSCQQGCGKCCDEPNGIVYLSMHDAQRIANNFSMSKKEWLQRDCRKTLDGRFVLKSRESDGICIYLNDNKQCDIYSVRPQQCAAYPWWAENLATEKAWKKTTLECPGLTAEDAMIIDGNTIKIHVLSDRQATRGFREIS